MTATVARRLGRSARTAYRVRLTRGCVVVAWGVLRGETLALHVKATASKRTERNGKRVTVPVYPRLRGSYLLQPVGSRARIAVTTLAIRSATTGG